MCIRSINTSHKRNTKEKQYLSTVTVALTVIQSLRCLTAQESKLVCWVTVREILILALQKRQASYGSRKDTPARSNRPSAPLLPRREQVFDPTKHPLLKVPEEAKLPEDKAVQQQQYLVCWKYSNDIERNANPGRRFGSDARQVKQGLLDKQHREAGAGEHDQNQDHLPCACHPPALF